VIVIEILEDGFWTQSSVATHQQRTAENRWTRKKSHEMENKIKLYSRRLLPVTHQSVTRDAANSTFMICHSF
jgi:hypothetical protein